MFDSLVLQFFQLFSHFVGTPKPFLVLLSKLNMPAIKLQKETVIENFGYMKCFCAFLHFLKTPNQSILDKPVRTNIIKLFYSVVYELS